MRHMATDHGGTRCRKLIRRAHAMTLLSMPAFELASRRAGLTTSTGTEDLGLHV